MGRRLKTNHRDSLHFVNCDSLSCVWAYDGALSLCYESFAFLLAPPCLSPQNVAVLNSVLVAS